MIRKRVWAVMVVTLLAGGCASTGNPFVRQSPKLDAVPASAIREAAEAIEKVVAQGNRDETITAAGGLVLDTPAIAQAIRTRAARAQLVSDFLDTGFAYEGHAGLLAVERSKEYKTGTTSRERDRYALIIMGENENRWALYEGIVEANDFGSRSLSAVQAIFANVRIEMLQSGQRYESEGGELVRK